MVGSELITAKSNFLYQQKQNGHKKIAENEEREKSCFETSTVVYVIMYEQNLNIVYDISYNQLHAPTKFVRDVTFIVLNIRFKLSSHHIMNTHTKNWFSLKCICRAPPGKYGGRFMNITFTEVPHNKLPNCENKWISANIRKHFPIDDNIYIHSFSCACIARFNRRTSEWLNCSKISLTV